MEVVADRTGGQQVSTDATEDPGRVRLNVALYAATVLLGCAAIWMGFVIASNDVWPPWQDDPAAEAPGLGEDMGNGITTEVAAADEADQKRVAAQLKAATSMVEAMVNLDFKDADAAIKAVQAQATGEFRQQYDKAAADVKKLAVQAQSTMKGTVIWTALVAGDKDSATVIAATTGSVANKTTEFKERANPYRVQVELVLVDGTWLTKDFQFVA